MCSLQDYVAEMHQFQFGSGRDGRSIQWRGAPILHLNHTPGDKRTQYLHQPRFMLALSRSSDQLAAECMRDLDRRSPE